MRFRRSGGIVAGMQFENTIGVELRGAAKTYRNAGTVVRAVRGIDVSIRHGRLEFAPHGAALDREEAPAQAYAAWVEFVQPSANGRHARIQAWPLSVPTWAVSAANVDQQRSE